MKLCLEQLSGVNEIYHVLNSCLSIKDLAIEEAILSLRKIMCIFNLC